MPSQLRSICQAKFLFQFTSVGLDGFHANGKKKPPMLALCPLPGSTPLSAKDSAALGEDTKRMGSVQNQNNQAE
jgi:hypothetical protein